MLSILGSCRPAEHVVNRWLTGNVEGSLPFHERAEHSRLSEGSVCWLLHTHSSAQDHHNMLNWKLLKCRRNVIRVSAIHTPSFNSLLAFRGRKLCCWYNSSRGKSFIREEDLWVLGFTVEAIIRSYRSSFNVKHLSFKTHFEVFANMQWEGIPVSVQIQGDSLFSAREWFLEPCYAYHCWYANHCLPSRDLNK